MSQMPASSTTSSRPPRRPAALRPSLRVVRPEASSVSHLPFVLLCACIMVAGLIAALLLNTALAKGSYEMHALETKSSQLDEEAQALDEVLTGLQGPQGLAARAAKLGMVRPVSSKWLDLTTGTVTGQANPADDTDTPAVIGDASFARSGATPSSGPLKPATDDPGGTAASASASSSPSGSASPTSASSPSSSASPASSGTSSSGASSTASTGQPGRTTSTRTATSQLTR